MNIEEISFIRDIKCLFKKKKHRKLIEQTQNKIRNNHLHKFTGTTIFQIFLVESKSCQQVVIKQIINLMQDKQNIETLFSMIFRNLKQCYAIFEKQMSEKMFYVENNNQSHIKALGKVKNSQIQKFMIQFFKVLLRTFYLLYFTIPICKRNNFFRQSQKSIGIFIEQIVRLQIKKPEINLLASQIYLVFMWEKTHDKIYNEAQKYFYLSFQILHYSFSQIKAEKINCKRQKKYLLQIQALVFLSLTLMIRLKIQKMQFQSILGLTHIFQYISNTFINLCTLWKKYLKEVIINLQILRIKMDSQLLQFAIPYLHKNFPSLSQIIAQQKQYMTKISYQNNAFEKHKQLKQNKNSDTSISHQKISTNGGINKNIVHSILLNNNNFHKKNQSGIKKNLMQNKLKKVIFDQVQINANQDIGSTMIQSKLDIFNKSYRILPINLQKNSKKTKKKGVSIKRSESASNMNKQRKRKALMGTVCLSKEQLMDSQVYSEQLYLKQIKQVKNSLKVRERSNMQLINEQNTLQNERLQKLDNSCQKSKISKIENQQLSNLLKRTQEINYQCNEDVHSQYKCYLNILRKHVNRQKNKKRYFTNLKLQHYFQKIDALQSKRRKINKQKQNGIDIKKIWQKKCISRPNKFKLSSKLVSHRGRSFHFIDHSRKPSQLQIEHSHNKSQQINHTLLNKIHLKQKNKTNRNKIKRSKYITKEMIFSFDTLL